MLNRPGCYKELFGNTFLIFSSPFYLGFWGMVGSTTLLLYVNGTARRACHGYEENTYNCTLALLATNMQNQQLARAMHLWMNMNTAHLDNSNKYLEQNHN